MVNIPQPQFAEPIVDGRGLASGPFRTLLLAIYQRIGGQSDAVDAAMTLAAGAAPQATLVVAAGGLQAGGDLTGNVGLALYAAVTTAAALPVTGLADGDWAYALDGRKPGEAGGAGTGVPVFFSGGAWISVCSGAMVTT